MVLPQFRRSALRPSRAAATLALAVALAGCGGPEKPAAPPPANPPQRWNLEMPAPAEQARFALDRLVTGPVPQNALPLGREQHQQVLRFAQRDLAALPEETRRLLEDPALVKRLTDPAVHKDNLNPWDNVLTVLLTLPDKTPALVRAWTEPALARDVPALALKAIDNLAAVEDPALAPLLLAFLERADQREVGRAAWSALARLPGPWTARALDHVRRRGAPDLWMDVAPLLELGLADDRHAKASENQLAWWALLTETSAPRGSVDLPRLKVLPWSALPRLFGAWAPPVQRVGETTFRAAGPYPEAPDLVLAWLVAAPEDTPVRTVYDLALVGTAPAADARCALARRGFPAYRAAVAADVNALFPEVAEKARHCLMGPEAVAGEKPTAFWERALAVIRKQNAGGDGAEPRLADVLTLAGRLPAPSDEEGRRVLLRVLNEARPMRTYQILVERAFAALASAGSGLEEEFLREQLAKASPEERGVALHLAQRSRSGALAPDLERLMEKAGPVERETVFRVLTWIHAGGRTEPAALEAFVRRYAQRVEQADDERAAAMAPGLLDLGDAGAHAFVAGLRGPRMRVFLAALAGYAGVAPAEAAEALADRVDAALPPDLRHAALVALWRTAPAEAAPAIAAIKGRLDPADRRAVDVVVETVSHRAARR
jgi:hypothetical protein